MSEPFPQPRREMGGYDAPTSRSMQTNEDPLAELARLVGKDDPFRSSRQQASNVARFPQLAAPRHDEPQRHDDFQEFDHEHGHYDAGLHGSFDPHGYDHAHAGQPRDDLHFAPIESGPEAFEPALGYPVAGGRAEAPALNADLWAEGALPQNGPAGDLFNDAPHHAQDKAAPRRTVIVLVAVVALTCGGLGATFLMRDGAGVHMGGGAPPTIMAADAPVKVQSPDMTSGNTQDSNTALLEKSGSDNVDNAKVVSNDEQPVDLNQLPKAGAAQADATAAAGSSSSPFPEPRKVKTVLIRPDGSVVGEAPQASSAASQSVGMVLPMAAGGSTQPDPAEAQPKPSTPKTTARAATTPSSAAGASGTKAAAVARAPKPVAVADAAEDAAPAPAAVAGTWAVQLGAPPSEKEAKEMSLRLQKKFAGDLGGLKPSIVKAEHDGKSIYRVRVSNLDQADAKALCAKLQAGGGSCFAVRN